MVVPQTLFSRRFYKHLVSNRILFISLCFFFLALCLRDRKFTFTQVSETPHFTFQIRCLIVHILINRATQFWIMHITIYHVFTYIIRVELILCNLSCTKRRFLLENVVKSYRQFKIELNYALTIHIHFLLLVLQALIKKKMT